MTGIETGITGGFGLLILVVAGLIFLLYLVPIPLWIAAWASGAYVGLFTLIGMRLRRVPPTTVVTARISAVKAGIDISINDLEAHFLASGQINGRSSLEGQRNVGLVGRNHGVDDPHDVAARKKVGFQVVDGYVDAGLHRADPRRAHRGGRNAAP